MFTPFIILIVIIITLAIALSLFKRHSEPESAITKYEYKKKSFFLTRAEHEFYDILTKAVGSDYLIFTQVHLPTLVDNKIVGQNWRGAFSHINGKSVDFVLCDKAYISPKLAIELDDKTHARPDRQERDREVEKILKQAGLPILRIENHGSFNVEEITAKIKESLKA